MAHHNFDSDMSKELRRLVGDLDDLKRSEKLGATGEYPHGRYGKHDEGEIRFAIAADRQQRKVLIDFGKPVHSLGMTPEQASELAELLIAKAMQAKGIDTD